MLGKEARKDRRQRSPPICSIHLPPQIINFVDQTDGGLRGAPKFPNTPIFEVLWRAGARLGKTPYRDLVRLTLTRMSQGGIYDHLGGGFARYSVDDHWLVPHFEKMLYDNAQLLELLALCHRDYGDAVLQTRAGEIVGWLKREMITGGGAFSASLDADSEGEEGKFYVWTWEELVEPSRRSGCQLLRQILWRRPHRQLVRRTAWQDGHGPQSARSQACRQRKTKPVSRRCRQKLFVARDKRVHPGLDDKIMADWNGLMIAARAACRRRSSDIVCVRARMNYQLI